jgi:coproporphyrinogen III oxidase-like Fe-S oxidoreductase
MDDFFAKKFRGSLIDGLTDHGIIRPSYEFEKAHTYPLSRPFWHHIDIWEVIKQDAVGNANKQELNPSKIWQKPFWLYFHVPFCNSKCEFCFYYKENCNLDPENDWDIYFNGIKAEIAFYLGWYNYSKINLDVFDKEMFIKLCDNYKEKIDKGILLEDDEKIRIWQLYIGGGTPNSFCDKSLRKLFDLIKKYFIVEEDKENEKHFLGTIEIAPEHITYNQIDSICSAEIEVLNDTNPARLIERISIGLQSFDDKKLKEYKRTRNWSQTNLNNPNEPNERYERYVTPPEGKGNSKLEAYIKDNIGSVSKTFSIINLIRSIYSQKNSSCLINIDLIYGLPKKNKNGNIEKDNFSHFKHDLDCIFEVFPNEKYYPDSLTLYYLRNIPWAEFSKKKEYLKKQLEWQELISLRKKYFEYFENNISKRVNDTYRRCRPHVMMKEKAFNDPRYKGAPGLDKNNYGRQLGFGPSAYSHLGYYVCQNLYPLNEWYNYIFEKPDKIDAPVKIENYISITEGMYLTENHRKTRSIVKGLLNTTGYLRVNKDKENNQVKEDNYVTEEIHFPDFSTKLKTLNCVEFEERHQRKREFISFINFYDKEKILLNVLKKNKITNQYEVLIPLSENGDSYDSKGQQLIKEDIKFDSDSLRKDGSIIIDNIRYIIPERLDDNVYYIKLNKYGELIDEEIIYYLYQTENINVASLEISKRVQQIFNDAQLKLTDEGYLSELLKPISKYYIPIMSDSIKNYIKFWGLISKLPKQSSILQCISNSGTSNNLHIEYLAKVIKDNLFDHQHYLKSIYKKTAYWNIPNENKYIYDIDIQKERIKFLFNSNLSPLLPSIRKDHFGYSFDYLLSARHFGSISIHHRNSESSSNLDNVTFKETFSNQSFNDLNQNSCFTSSKNEIIYIAYKWIKKIIRTERIINDLYSEEHTKDDKNKLLDTLPPYFKIISEKRKQEKKWGKEQTINQVNDREATDPFIYQSIIAEILMNSQKYFLHNYKIKTPLVYLFSDVLSKDSPSVSIPKIAGEDAMHIFCFRGNLIGMIEDYLLETSLVFKEATEEKNKEKEKKEIEKLHYDITDDNLKDQLIAKLDKVNSPKYIHSLFDDIFSKRDDYRSFLDDFKNKLIYHLSHNNEFFYFDENGKKQDTISKVRDLKYYELVEMIFPFVYFGQPLLFSCQTENLTDIKQSISFSMIVDPLSKSFKEVKIPNENSQAGIDNLINYSSIISSGLFAFVQRFNESIRHIASTAKLARKEKASSDTLKIDEPEPHKSDSKIKNSIAIFSSEIAIDIAEVVFSELEKKSQKRDSLIGNVNLWTRNFKHGTDGRNELFKIFKECNYAIFLLDPSDECSIEYSSNIMLETGLFLSRGIDYIFPFFLGNKKIPFYLQGLNLPDYSNRIRNELGKKHEVADIKYSLNDEEKEYILNKELGLNPIFNALATDSDKKTLLNNIYYNVVGQVIVDEFCKSKLGFNTKIVN